MNVLITGGGSGSGRSMVERFSLDTQNKVLFTYFQSAEDSLNTLLENGNVAALKCDFTRTEDLNTLIEKATIFEPDLLVNNSWLDLTRKHFHRFDHGELLESFGRNVAPTVELNRQVLKFFKKRRSGKIINVLTSALLGKPPVGMSVYAAEKSYIMQLSKSWVSEFSGFNVAINNVLPGFMDTNMNSDVDTRVVKLVKESSPDNELLTTEELAEAVYLLARMPRQVTGNSIVIDKGSSLNI